MHTTKPFYVSACDLDLIVSVVIKRENSLDPKRLLHTPRQKCRLVPIKNLTAPQCTSLRLSCPQAQNLSSPSGSFTSSFLYTGYSTGAPCTERSYYNHTWITRSQFRISEKKFLVSSEARANMATCEYELIMTSSVSCSSIHSSTLNICSGTHGLPNLLPLAYMQL